MNTMTFKTPWGRSSGLAKGLALLALGRQHSEAKLTKLVAVIWHLGLWCFVWTILAGVFALPFYYSQLAPIGGQLLIAAWLLLAISAWRRS